MCEQCLLSRALLTCSGRRSCGGHRAIATGQQAASLRFEHNAVPTKATAPVAAAPPVRRLYLPHRPQRPSCSCVVVLACAAEPPLSARQNSGGVGLTPEGPAECSKHSEPVDYSTSSRRSEDLLPGRCLGSVTTLAFFEGSPWELRILWLVDGCGRGASNTAHTALPPSVLGRTPKVRDRPATTVRPRPCRSASRGC